LRGSVVRIRRAGAGLMLAVSGAREAAWPVANLDPWRGCASPTLQALFERLEDSGMSHCLLRGRDELRLVEDAYEIDLLVAPQELNRFRAVAADLGFECMPSWGSAPHVFFVTRESNPSTWIKLDVVTDLRYGPSRTLRIGRVADYLHRTRLIDGIRVLAAADEFVHLVLHGILDKGRVEPRHQARLQALRHELRSSACGRLLLAEHFRSLAPAMTWADATSACDQADWSQLERRGRMLRRQLTRQQLMAAAWRRMCVWSGRRLRPFRLPQRPRGLVVALLGPDGAGKTAVATTLARSMPLVTRRVYMGYGRRDDERGSATSRMMWRLAGEVPEGGRGPIRRVRLAMRWAARIALQTVRSVVVRTRRSAGQVVLLDRHVYDLSAANSSPSSPSRVKRALRRWLTAIGPTPDLVVSLDVPAEILCQRKAEWPIEVLARQRVAYRELALRLPNGLVIDASQEFDRVCGNVSDEVWRRYGELNRRAKPDAAPAASAAATAETKSQLRGSSLLLSGRFLALAVTAIAQVLLIRYLAPADFGRWMYALSVVTVLKSVACLGIDRSVARFASMYYERGDRARLLGVMVLTIGAVVGLGGLMILTLYVMPDQVMRLMQNQPEPLRLLFILIFLVPLEAMDSLLIGIFASFGNARAIFFRRYVVAPGLRLTAVLIAVVAQASVVGLAYAYVIGAAIGVLVYGRHLWRLCREAGLFTAAVGMTLPVREVFGFTAPMLIADVAIALMYGAGALALGYHSDMASVAVFGAALPLAVLNQSVMRSFSLLYTASASKLLARGDRAGINELYWRTAVWLAVLTFPIFALTFTAAAALTEFLYGTRYAAAGPILAVLALGEYVNAALGFNGLTLRVLNRAKYLTTISAAAAVVAILCSFWAAPRYGAWGVAVATAATMILHNLFKQLGLRLATGVTLFDQRYARFYLVLIGATTALVAANWMMPGPPIVLLLLTGSASVGLLLLSKRVLNIAEVFPEIRRVPVLRTLLA
jgi:O-antigen/teichoic acid export membrane protein/thymidylate kinase